MLYNAMLDPHTDAEYLHRKVAASCRSFSAVWGILAEVLSTRDEGKEEAIEDERGGVGEQTR
jgi:hypothetical protein